MEKIETFFATVKLNSKMHMTICVWVRKRCVGSAPRLWLCFVLIFLRFVVITFNSDFLPSQHSDDNKRTKNTFFAFLRFLRRFCGLKRYLQRRLALRHLTVKRRKGFVSVFYSNHYNNSINDNYFSNNNNDDDINETMFSINNI